MRVLVLAGSAEASALVRRLHDEPDVDVVASLAGRVAVPTELPGEVRVGGFGGVKGLRRTLVDDGVDALVDATHPFAARMAAQAAEAATAAGVPRVRLRRPPWTPTDGDRWHEVDTLEEAAAILRSLGRRRPFLAVGRQHVDQLADLAGAHPVLRSIDRPDELPWEATVVLARGPFAEPDERRLLVDHGCDAVVARNSGGAGHTKLDAARSLGLPVVLVRPPPPPPGDVVTTVDQAVAWLHSPR